MKISQNWLPSRCPLCNQWLHTESFVPTTCWRCWFPSSRFIHYQKFTSQCFFNRNRGKMLPCSSWGKLRQLTWNSIKVENAIWTSQRGFSFMENDLNPDNFRPPAGLKIHFHSLIFHMTRDNATTARWFANHNEAEKRKRLNGSDDDCLPLPSISLSQISFANLFIAGFSTIAHHPFDVCSVVFPKTFFPSYHFDDGNADGDPTMAQITTEKISMKT